MSGDKINSKKDGGSLFCSKILLNPAPNETPTKSCGAIPIIDPKKKFLIFTLNKVGKIFDIKKGIPPTNR